MNLISLHGAGINGIPVGNNRAIQGVHYYGDDFFGDNLFSGADVQIPSNALNFLGDTVTVGESDFAFLGKSSIARKTIKVTKKAGTATKKGVVTTARVTTKVALAPVKVVAKLSAQAYSKSVAPLIKKYSMSIAKGLGQNLLNKGMRDSAINKATLVIASTASGLTGVGGLAIAPVAKVGLTKALDEAVKNFKKTGTKVMANALKKGASPVQAKALAKKTAVQASVITAQRADVSPSAVEEQAKSMSPAETSPEAIKEGAVADVSTSSAIGGMSKNTMMIAGAGVAVVLFLMMSKK